MQKNRRLFIDKISNDFNPEKDFVLGPWCLINKFTLSQIKECYEKGIFLEDKSIDHIKAFRCCEEQHARLIGEIANYVKYINKNKYSLGFYEDYVSNWFTSFIHLMHYSTRLINEYIKNFDDENIELILFYKAKKIEFINTKDFISKLINQYDFFPNFVLFLLLKNKPKKWKITYLNSNTGDESVRKKQSKLYIYYTKFVSVLTKYLAPRVSHVYGLNIFEKILVSFILTLKKPLTEEKFRRNYYSKIKETYSDPPISDSDMIKLAKELLPYSLKEIWKKKERYKNCFGKIMLCSASSLLANDDEKFDLLFWKEKKGRIFSVQHGAHYGESLLLQNSMEFLDKFISWGQKSHQNQDIDMKPLPSPQLQIKYKKNYSKKILFVSASNFYFYPRYTGAQSFDETVSKINDSIYFLSELGTKFIDKINYKIDLCHFSEEAILKRKFKSLKFINTLPEKNLNKSKLIVLNCHSTFFLKSLVANVPIICFWKRNCWKLTDKAIELFEVLHEAEILFYDSKLAAKKVINIWNNTNQWWNTEKIQKARTRFCDEFANQDDKWLSKWIQYFKKEV